VNKYESVDLKSRRFSFATGGQRHMGGATVAAGGSTR